MRFSRCDVRHHINYRKNDRWPSYRFYRAWQRLKSPMRYICEIFGSPRFSSFKVVLLDPAEPHENLAYRAIEYPSQKFHAQRPSGR